MAHSLDSKHETWPALMQPDTDWQLTADLAAALVRQQHPPYRHLELTALAQGWDNATFRLGPDLLVRLPRRRTAAQLLAKEVEWLPTMASLSSLPIPRIVAVGEATPAYPAQWVIMRWLPGAVFATQAGTTQNAAELGQFLRGLHQPAPANAPRNRFRGVRLRDRDSAVMRALSAVSTQVDVEDVMAQWRAGCQAAPNVGVDRWLHGDLHPLNILREGYDIAGVIDFGDLCAGDPATDLAIAWQLFGSAERAVFWRNYFSREGVPDPARIARARGWGIFFGVLFLANSQDDPVMAAVGKQTLGRLGVGLTPDAR